MYLLTASESVITRSPRVAVEVPSNRYHPAAGVDVLAAAVDVAIFNMPLVLSVTVCVFALSTTK
jgi:hypothetical protein